MNHSYPRFINSINRHGSQRPCLQRRLLRGNALITSLVFAVVIALILAGIGTLTVSHYSYAHTEADSAAALDLAEAGINYELHKITENIGQADVGSGNTYAAATLDPSLTGTFNVTCANRDGSPWNASTAQQISIYCTGVVNGAQRTVRIDAQPTGAFYTTYSLYYTRFNNDNAIVNGVCGTNQYIAIPNDDPNQRPTITSVALNGPGARWSPSDPGGYKQVANSKPVTWNTVDAIMNKTFSGGANYLATHNDNALATMTQPGVPGQQSGIQGSQMSAMGSEVVTLKGKAGGANYYLTDILFDDNSSLQFDTTNGPISIWYNPSASAAGVYLRGCNVVNGPLSNHVLFYSAGAGIVQVQPDTNNDRIDMGLYAYNLNSTGRQIGGITLSGAQTFHGQVVGNSITINNAAQITGEKGYFDIPEEYFAFSGNWCELDSNGNIGGGTQ